MSTGHLIVAELAGSVTLTVHESVGPFCNEVASIVLDPKDVSRLADAFTRAAIPPPPVVERRLVVRRRPDGHWFVICPECFPLEGAWHDQPAALDAALEHLTAEHASEVSS